MKLNSKQRIVFWICLIDGICAVFFGGLMMLFPVDTPLGMGALLPAMGSFPLRELFFQTLFWSGLALLLWNGSMNLVASVAFISKVAVAPKLSLAAGVMLVCWCAFEYVFLPNPPALFYGAVGIVKIVLSWPRPKSTSQTEPTPMAQPLDLNVTSWFILAS